MIRRLVLVALFAIPFVTPSPAQAGGFEYVGSGTRAFGRGGAFMARADDPMALRYNPAALAFNPGYQLQLGSHVAFYDACMQRANGYDDGDGDGADFVSDAAIFESRFGYPDPSDPGNFASQPFPRVCRNGYPGPSPQLVFSAHPIPELGFAIGILAPSAVGNATWGNPDGSVDVDGMNLPSPARYNLVQQDLLLFHPSIGVGYSPAKWISIGVTLQWGVAIASFTNHTSVGSGLEDPADDIRTEVNITDPFIPAIIASVHLVPIEQLDIVAMARISDGINGNGTLGVTTGVFGTSGVGSYTPYTTELAGARLSAGQPWEFGLSARYAHRTAPRRRETLETGPEISDGDEVERESRPIADPMADETFDVELDVVYQVNSQVSDFVVTPPEGATAGICEEDSDCSAGPTLAATLPATLPIPKGWRDQLSIRLGGDWNILPNQLAIRGGVHFETSGLSQRYQTPDFLPGMRLGLHLGATYRIDRFDVSIAYGHIFQFDETVSDAQHRLIAAQDGGMGAYTCPGGEYMGGQPVSRRGCYPTGYGSVVNAATFRAEYNVISLSARYNFE